MGEMISAHAVLGFQVADDRLDRRPALEFAFDRLGDAPLLPRDEHAELMGRRRIVAAIAAIGDDAFDRRPDLLFHFRDHGRQRMAVIRIARQRFHMGDELAALRAIERRRHRHLDAELVRAMRLAS